MDDNSTITEIDEDNFELFSINNNLPNDLSTFTNLTSISVENNTLNKWPKIWSDSLEYLVFESNHFTSFPTTWPEKIEYFDIQNNPITHIRSMPNKACYLGMDERSLQHLDNESINILYNYLIKYFDRTNEAIINMIRDLHHNFYYVYPNGENEDYLPNPTIYHAINLSDLKQQLSNAFHRELELIAFTRILCKTPKVFDINFIYKIHENDPISMRID